jgi:hypothetical protein
VNGIRWHRPTITLVAPLLAGSDPESTHPEYLRALVELVAYSARWSDGVDRDEARERARRRVLRMAHQDPDAWPSLTAPAQPPPSPWEPLAKIEHNGEGTAYRFTLPTGERAYLPNTSLRYASLTRILNSLLP